jgi:hypothetical protein
MTAFPLAPTLQYPDIPLPLMALVRQHLAENALPDRSAALRDELKRLPVPPDLQGKKVALGVGSRGIADLQELVRELADFIRDRNGRPFIVPAMGSHGGATAEGQRDVLAGYGITETRIGAPIVSSMETVRIGSNAAGIPVYCDKNAWEADYLVPLNRVKPHTQFRAATESGLLKMLVIGFGKESGAAIIHGYGVRGLVEYIPASAQVFLQSGKVLFGLAVVEDGKHRIARIRALPPGQLIREEALLLREARELMPRLPVESLDMLVLDRMGKDISGPGMDSAVTGRIMANGIPDPPFPRIALLAVLDLSDASHGNAVGVGVADLISRRLNDKIDLQATYMNAIVGGFPVQGKIPMVMPDDRQLFRAAAILLGATPLADCRMIRAADTLDLELLRVSRALLPELRGRNGIEVLEEPSPMAFDRQNDLVPLEQFHFAGMTGRSGRKSLRDFP